MKSVKRDTSGLVCPYCDEVPAPQMGEVIGHYKGEWHHCKFVDAMVRFIPESHKKQHPDKPKGRPEKPIKSKNQSEGLPYYSGSYLIPLAKDNPSPVFGRPTRGRHSQG